MKLIKYYPKFYVCGAFLLLIVFVFGANPAVFLASLLLSLFITSRLYVMSHSSKVFNLIVSVVILMTTMMSGSLLVWLINKNSSLDTILLFSFAILLITSVLLVMSNRKDKLRHQQIRLVTIDDYLAIFIAIFILAGMIVFPAFRDNPRTLQANLTDFISMGTDDNNHLGMFADKLELDRGILNSTDQADKASIMSGTNIYPTSWHTANAVIIKTFINDISESTHEKVLLAYVITKLFWMFVLLYLFIRVFLFVTRILTLKNELDVKINLALAFFLSGFFAYYLLLEQFIQGFYNFIPVIIGFLLLSFFMAHTVADKEEPHSTAIITFGGLSALSWPLVLPALCLSVLLAYLNSNSNPVQWFKKFYKSIRYQIIIAGAILIAVALQLYLLVAPGSRSISGVIIEPGAIAQHSSWFYFYIVAGFSALLLQRQDILHKRLNYTVILASCLSLCCFILYAYQTLKSGTVDYYFYKLLNVLMIVLAPLSTAGFLLIIYRQFSQLSSSLPIYTMIACAVPMLIGINPTNTSNTDYVKGKRSFSNAENTTLYNAFTGDDTRIINYESGKDSVAITLDQPSFNIITSSMLRSAKKLHPCNEKSYAAAVTNDANALVSAVKLCPEEVQLNIYTRGDNKKELDKLFDNNKLSNRVEVYTLGM